MKMPDFTTEEEEMKFWEKHSIGDYWEDLAECSDTFKRPKLKPVTLKFARNPRLRIVVHCQPLFRCDMLT